MIRCTLIPIILLFPLFMNAQQPVLVRDINPGSASSNFSIDEMTVVGDVLFFNVREGVHGRELWRSDGTENGTVLVKDIEPGAGADGAGAHLIVYDSVLYFSGTTSEHGSELWRSDGTENGTYLFYDECIGACYGLDYSAYDSPFAIYHDSLYLRSSSSASGTELFRTAGDSSMLTLVKNIVSGVGSSNPASLTVWNDKLYFKADDFMNGQELWVSDGTSQGTVMLKDIYPGFSSAAPSKMVPAGNIMFFQASGQDTGLELWKTDGTADGTVLVKDIRPGTSGGIVSNAPVNLLNNKLIFLADDGINGEELWVSDGTEGGTMMLKNVAPGGFNSFSQPLGIVGNKLVFTADLLDDGPQLWVTDGTVAGTVLLKDFWPNSSLGYFSSNGAVRNGVLYFGASNAANGAEIWKTNGTTAGTQLFSDIVPGAGNSAPDYFHLAGSTLFFTANTPGVGSELWKISFVAPTAAFEVQDTVCQSTPVTFSTTSAGNFWSWSFGIGAQPSFASGAGPHNVTFSGTGTKTVRLIVGNSVGADTAFQTFQIVPVSQAGFTFTSTDLTVDFANSSTEADHYLWQFGDGQSSTDANPTHTYEAPGVYTVTLQASNECSNNVKTITLTLTSGIDDIRNNSFAASIYPNPVQDKLWLNCPSCQGKINYHLIDALGRRIHSGYFTASPGVPQLIETNEAALHPGAYYMVIQQANGASMVPFVVQKQ